MVSQKFIKLFKNLNFNVTFIRDYDKRFVCTGSPWFDRGSMFSGGIGAGVFAFGVKHGSVDPVVGFRDSNYDK